MDTVRASRDGHEYHETWIARKALQLLRPDSVLKAIAVEGLSPLDQKTAPREAVEIADIVLHYDGTSFANSSKSTVIQIKYSIASSDTPFRTSNAKKTRFLSPNLPANASLNGGTGEFRFKPILNQVGPHMVTFQVTDGKDITSQTVMLLVQPADANQVTALSSRVIDANSFSAGQTVPLAGVRVSVLGSTVTTTTDSMGRFTLSGIPHGSQIITLDALRCDRNHPLCQLQRQTQYSGKCIKQTLKGLYASPDECGNHSQPRTNNNCQ